MVGRTEDSAIVWYLVLVTALSAVFWAIIIHLGHLAAGGGHYVEGLMWCPAAAAFLTILFRRLDMRTLGLAWGSGRYEAMGYLTPLAYAAIAYALVWILGLGGFPNPAAVAALSAKLQWNLPTPAFVPVYFVFAATVLMISSVAHALGEEIGWRGFLAPRLVKRFGFTGGAIVAGVIWAAWHMPILLFADYNSGTPWWFAMTCFTVLVLSSSVMLTWLRLRSGSVWPCAILHASHNLFIQAFFTPLTTPRPGITPYVIDEFGFAVPLIGVLFAIGFWSQRGKLAPFAGLGAPAA